MKALDFPASQLLWGYSFSGVENRREITMDEEGGLSYSSLGLCLSRDLLSSVPLILRKL